MFICVICGFSFLYFRVAKKTKPRYMLKLIPVILLISFSFAGKAQINMVVKQDGFLFMEGSDSICFYQKSPKDKGGEFSRCNYIHPLYDKMEQDRLKIFRQIICIIGVFSGSGIKY